jgi:transposase
MVKRLTMAEIDTILTLHKAGESKRAIAALLGKDRETIGRYLARAQAEMPPNAPTGKPCGDPNEGRTGHDDNNGPTPVASEIPPDQPAIGALPAGSANLSSGPPSECEPFRQQILAKVEQGLEAVRIHQDLVEDHGEQAPSYYSVRRFIAKMRKNIPLPFRRMETEPAEEAQVDFGSGAVVRTVDGKLRRPWIFRIVLSYSRKGYSEAVWRQSSEDFIACLENAFRHFGGVPRRLVIDNLKAVVARGDWYDPEVHPKLQSFARHYGTVFLPTKPYTPRHKGKIESGVKYVKRNALKARVFTSLAAENEFLLNWETRIADQRIHGTIKQQVEKLFEQAERKELLPLPAERFPFFHEARRAVHRDGHLEVDKAYYSVPPEYVGSRLWVRWESRLVRIYNDRWEQLAVHAKAEPGRFRTASQHIPEKKFSAVERGTDALLRQIAAIGPQTRQWAEATTQARGVEAVRVLVGLKDLAGKHDVAALEEACRVALSHGAYRLRTVRQLLKRKGPEQKQFEFLESHPIIRPLSDYSLTSLLQFRKDRHPDERQTG